MANTVDIVINGKDNSSAATRSAKVNVDALGESTDQAATKAGTAVGAFGALGSGFELFGQEGSAAAAATQTAALAVDAFSGIADFATLALQSSTFAKIKDTAATVASRVAQIAASAATKAWAATQWLLNAALTANPIGIVIALIVALVAGIILAYRNSETFRKIVDAAGRVAVQAFKSVWNAVQTLIGFIQRHWPLISNILIGPFKVWINIVTSSVNAVIGIVKKIPGAMKSIFSGVANTISAPFRAAGSGIRSAWNSTVGGKGFTVPSWVPEIGGSSFHIPYLATGGIRGGFAIAGERGAELINLPQGSRVRSAADTSRLLGQGGREGNSVKLVASDNEIGRFLVRILQKAIRTDYSGNVTVALGSGI